MLWGPPRKFLFLCRQLDQMDPLPPALPTPTHTIGIRYAKPGGYYSPLGFQGCSLLCQHCHGMKVRTRSSEIEGEKIKGKVCGRKERLFNCSVNPVFFSWAAGVFWRWMDVGTAGTGDQLWAPSGYHLVADRFFFRPKSPPIVVVREGKWEAHCVFFHFRRSCSKPPPLPVLASYQREGNYLIVGWRGWGS